MAAWKYRICGWPLFLLAALSGDFQARDVSSGLDRRLYILQIARHLIDVAEFELVLDTLHHLLHGHGILDRQDCVVFLGGLILLLIPAASILFENLLISQLLRGLLLKVLLPLALVKLPLVDRHIRIKDILKHQHLVVQILQFVVEVRVLLLAVGHINRVPHVLWKPPVLFSPPLFVSCCRRGIVRWVCLVVSNCFIGSFRLLENSGYILSRINKIFIVKI